MKLTYSSNYFEIINNRGKISTFLEIWFVAANDPRATRQSRHSTYLTLGTRSTKITFDTWKVNRYIKISIDNFKSELFQKLIWRLECAAVNNEN